MEHVNSSATIRQQQQHQQLQQHHQEQQQQHEHQQQFCLRWHNHQTSLLSTLPILLDQSHLTDVTISAEGRTLRAHRVVLSACSTFFLELFRALDTSNHPIIIIPGASFAAIVALLTFMYSGEVNVYEEQIPMLLNLAETLGIKGLADVQNNKSTKQRQQATDLFDINQHKDEPTEMPATPSPPLPPPPPLPPTIACSNAEAAIVQHQQQQHVQNTQFPMLPTATAAVSTLNSLTSPLLSNKFPTPLESFFLKSLQFYPNLLPQPLNFSQTALNKTTELLAKYQQQCNLYQSALGGLATAKELLPQLNSGEELIGQSSNSEEIYSAAKRLCTGEKKPPQQHQQQHHSIQQLHHQQQQQTKDIKRIDRIVENLRCGNKTPNSHEVNTNVMQQQQTLHNSLNVKTGNGVCNYTPTMLSPHLATKPPIFVNATSASPSLASLTVAQQNQHQQQQQHQLQHHQQQHSPYITAEDQVAKLQQHIDQYAASCSREIVSSKATSSGSVSGGIDAGGNVCPKSETGLMSMLPEKHQSTPTTPIAQTPSSPQNKTPSNSKLYATCFICHKQLSNQYNLRVHLETHQNVRYACNVCSHVSRSKDALRKHVSYRHPGAPSPCESDARRKRGAAKMLNTVAPITVTAPTGGACSSPTSPSTGAGVTMAGPFHLSAALNTTGSSSGNVNSNIDNEMQQMTAAAAQLSSPAYMFLPNQFHLSQQQEQQRQHIQNMVDAHNAVISATAAAAAAAVTTAAGSSTTPTISVTNSMDVATSTGGNASSNAGISNAITLTIATAATTPNSNNNNNNNSNDTNVSSKSEHHSPALASTLSSPVLQQDKSPTATAAYTVGGGGSTPRSSPSAATAATP